MSRVIRLPSQLIEDIYDYLEENNLGSRDLSATKAVQKIISLGLFQTPNIKDGRELSGKLFGDGSTLLKTKVARWSQHTDWGRIERKTGIPEDVQRELAETSQRISQETSQQRTIETKEDLIKEDPKEDTFTPIRNVTSEAPWEYLPRVPFPDIELAYPKHLISDWIKQEEDDLRLKAAECAFGIVPKTLHKSIKLIEQAESLYSKFKTWREEHNG